MTFSPYWNPLLLTFLSTPACFSDGCAVTWNSSVYATGNRVIRRGAEQSNNKLQWWGDIEKTCFTAWPCLTVASVSPGQTDRFPTEKLVFRCLLSTVSSQSKPDSLRVEDLSPPKRLCTCYCTIQLSSLHDTKNSLPCMSLQFWYLHPAFFLAILSFFYHNSACVCKYVEFVRRNLPFKLSEWGHVEKVRTSCPALTSWDT